MHLVVVGLNHRSAPIEVRERLTFPDRAVSDAVRRLVTLPGIREAAILSTCNRTELYVLASEPDAARTLLRFLGDYHALPPERFEPHFYAHADVAAIRHLFRVTCGLDSLVLGEAQILGQVRTAFTQATKAGTVGAVLNGLFRAAIATGRRARTETAIGSGGFSVGHAAVDLAHSIFGSLKGATILILGAGKMSELTAKHLLAQGSRFVLVANRTHAKAVTLAERLGGKAIHYDEFPQQLAAADIVISSTAAPTPILRRDMVQPVLRRRRGRPLFLIDIAVPRDIASDVGELENVFLYDVDDLEEVVAEQSQGRSGEVANVEQIIGEEENKFLTWWKSLDAVPVLTAFRQKHETIRQEELTRLRNQLPHLNAREWQCIEAATRSMLTRVGRDAIARLKESTQPDAAQTLYTLLEAARIVFGLEAVGEAYTEEQEAQNGVALAEPALPGDAAVREEEEIAR